MRTLESLKSNSLNAKKKCADHLGSIHPPLLNISINKIILDELHLLLRIMDILIRNLINFMEHWNQMDKRAGIRGPNHIQALATAITSCGITFKVWPKKDCHGAPVAGQYEFTALNGGEKKLLRELPEKFTAVFPPDFATLMHSLWNVCFMPEFLWHTNNNWYVIIDKDFEDLYQSISAAMDADTFHSKVSLFKSVTLISLLQ